MKRVKSKICLVGEKAVGKTSLVRRFVMNMFDEQYVTTIGTRVSKKEVHISMPDVTQSVQVDLMIWDIMGEKGFRELLKDAYFYGANGILAVADLTRRRTLDDLDDWIDSVEQVVGKVPILIAVNKADLASNARFQERDVAEFAKAYGAQFFLTSAKTGDQVETAFARLAALPDPSLAMRVERRGPGPGAGDNGAGWPCSRRGPPERTVSVRSVYARYWQLASSSHSWRRRSAAICRPKRRTGTPHGPSHGRWAPASASPCKAWTLKPAM